MTHDAITLEQYFHLIVNKQQKEPTMFENLKAHFMSLWTKPVAFVEEPDTAMEEDYWAFEMVTQEWINEYDEWQPLKQSVVIEAHEGTWMQVLDRILDEMSKHYGYNIKEQVYYSVKFPLNDPECAGYGRELNDDVLQQLLLAFPEIYDTISFEDKSTKGIFE